MLIIDNRWKLGYNVFFDQLNTYHQNIKLIIEINPSKLSNLPTSMVPLNSTLNEKTQNYLHHGSPKLQNVIHKIQSIRIFIIQKEIHQTLMKKFL